MCVCDAITYYVTTVVISVLNFLLESINLDHIIILWSNNIYIALVV